MLIKSTISTLKESVHSLLANKATDWLLAHACMHASKNLRSKKGSIEGSNNMEGSKDIFGSLREDTQSIPAWGTYFFRHRKTST